MVSEYGQKVNAWFMAYKSDLFTSAVIFLVGLASFGLGRLSAVWPEKQPVTLIGAPAGEPDKTLKGAVAAAESSSAAGTAFAGAYVASRSGKYYYLPTCAGAGRIKESNKIWFATRREAETRGLKPAANCPGL